MQIDCKGRQKHSTGSGYPIQYIGLSSAELKPIKEMMNKKHEHISGDTQSVWIGDSNLQSAVRVDQLTQRFSTFPM